MTTPIPLHCNICPKQPDFSDVSHLLTHIASKGHLSHYYKVKVRSGTEAQAAEQIDTYDRWYAEWNVEELMSERMNLKDKKRPRTRLPGEFDHTVFVSMLAIADSIWLAPRASNRRGTPSSHGPSARCSTLGPRAASRSAMCASENVLDPRLSDHPIKIEHHSASPFMDQTSLYHGHIPRMVRWPTTYPSPTPIKEQTSTDSSIGSEYGEPPRRRLKAFWTDDQDENNDMIVSESNKLKGILWPGMDIFDSATPEMRRKRNQKKDTSVLEQLEQNSQEVEPNELVFTPSGSFKRQRRISHLLDEESSPIKISPIKRRPRRPVLGDLDINCPGLPRLRSHGRHASLFASSENAIIEDEEEEDFKLTYGQPFGSKKKRPFDIFQDKTEDQVSFDHPAPLNFLTSEFRVPENQSFQLGLNTNHNTFSNIVNPGPDVKPNTNNLFPFDDKENFDLSQFQYGYNFSNNTSTSTYNFAMADLGPPAEFPGFFSNPLIFNPYKTNADPDADDEGRTISAPPSEI